MEMNADERKFEREKGERKRKREGERGREIYGESELSSAGIYSIYNEYSFTDTDLV